MHDGSTGGQGDSEGPNSEKDVRANTKWLGTSGNRRTCLARSIMCQELRVNQHVFRGFKSLLLFVAPSPRLVLLQKNM